MDGFDVIGELSTAELPPCLHHLHTAYDRYALRAFEIHAVDYLLKPSRSSGFAPHAARTRSHPLCKQNRRRPPKGPNGTPYTTRIVFKSKGRILFLLSRRYVGSERRRTTSASARSRRHTCSRDHDAPRREARPQHLPPRHRSSIVNLQYVKEVSRGRRRYGVHLLNARRSHEPHLPLEDQELARTLS